MVYFEECKVGGAVEEISKTDEGIRGFQVQKKDSSQEGHALDVANVWSIAGIGTEHIMEGFIIRTTLCGMECGKTLFVSESHSKVSPVGIITMYIPLGRSRGLGKF